MKPKDLMDLLFSPEYNGSIFLQVGTKANLVNVLSVIYYQ